MVMFIVAILLLVLMPILWPALWLVVRLAQFALLFVVCWMVFPGMNVGQWVVVAVGVVVMQLFVRRRV